MSRKRYTFLPLFALTVLFAFLIPLNLIATTWGEVSVYLMMHKADIIAICEVVRYPCNTIPSTPDEETAGRGLGFIRPGFIRIRLIDVLVGIEDDKDLLVDWVDRSRDTSIKEGHEYIVFLWRRAGKMLFLNEPPESERRINYAGIEINNNYQRFNSKYWIREIADGKIVWVNDQILSIDEFTALISREREKRARFISG